jgi:UDP-N-acetylmuramoylalanine--D-glutamate ligase
MTTPPPVAIDLERLDLDSFRGRPVAVLGLARSGLALTRFLVDRGADVTVYDVRPADELADAVAALDGRQVHLMLGPQVDPTAALRGQALICTSPSVSSRFPNTEPRLRAALLAVEQRSEVPVLSEVDLFLRLCPATTIGVTGTKGKTTTSTLCAAVLAAGVAPVVMGGNMGLPLIEHIPQLTPTHRVVLELSELQLPTLSFGTDVAVYTHVTSDHLDRHGSVDAYRAVKRRLAELLPEGGTLVRNEDDPVVSTYAAPTGARTVPYGRATPAAAGVGVSDGWISAGAELTGPGGDRRVMHVAEIPLPGEHSVSNVLAATAVGLIHGVAPAGIAAAVRAFGGVEHRLEPVAEIAGVRYVNDSQGTQPDAVIAALRSFGKPLVLIAGGRSKGVPIGALASIVAERATAAVLIGETADEFAAAFAAAGLGRIERADSMRAAVATATAIARATPPATASAAGPATVLLSPAAASFDMFPDYEARGAAFKEAVGALVPGATTGPAVEGSR